MLDLEEVSVELLKSPAKRAQLRAECEVGPRLEPPVIGDLALMPCPPSRGQGAERRTSHDVHQLCYLTRCGKASSTNSERVGTPIKAKK